MDIKALAEKIPVARRAARALRSSKPARRSRVELSPTSGEFRLLVRTSIPANRGQIALLWPEEFGPLNGKLVSWSNTLRRSYIYVPGTAGAEWLDLGSVVATDPSGGFAFEAVHWPARTSAAKDCELLAVRVAADGTSEIFYGRGSE